MSDREDEGEEFDTAFDDNSHRACYIFTPSNDQDNLIDDRPTKRRKTHYTPQADSPSFPLLFNGAESPHCAELRQEIFHRLWQTAASSIEKVIDQVDDKLVKTIATFLDSEESTDRLRIGLTDSGDNSGAQSRLLARWKQQRSLEIRDVVVADIQPSHCVNVQSALRNIIRLAISDHSGQDGYQTLMSKFKRLIPMNYDLELLQMFVEANRLTNVVLSLPDIETFDMSIISELLNILHSWLDRIPICLLLGVNTTIQLFESRLPRAITHLLDIHVLELGQSADFFPKMLGMVQDDIDIVVPRRLSLGPAALLSLQELTENQGCGIRTLRNAIKYMYMAHLFANPFSVLLGGKYEKFSTVEQSLLAEAIRNTTSFRDLCEKLCSEEKERTLVRSLLGDDAELISKARFAVSEGESMFAHALRMIMYIKDLYKHLPRQTSDRSSTLALSFGLDMKLYSSCERLRSVEIVNDIVETLKKLSHSEMLIVFSKLDEVTIQFLDVEQFRQAIWSVFDLGPIVPNIDDPRSVWPNYDLTFNPGRSTVPIGLLPIDKEAAYKIILDRMVQAFEGDLRCHSFNVTKEFMHEAFLFNSRIPLNTAFNPRPRFTIERALGTPADYLGCDCCTTTTSSAHNSSNHNSNGTTTKEQSPPTSILYNLLQEAGTIINVRDLFEAFKSNMFPTSNNNQNMENEDEDEQEEESEDQKSQERLALSLFYRSLSELKMLGMVKSSTSAIVKKKALQSNAAGVSSRSKSSAGGRYGDIDFIAKTSWAGL